MRESTNPKTIAIRAALKAMNWNIPPPPMVKPEPWSCPSFTYSDYLASDHWAEVRQGALERAGYACQLCNDTNDLQVHHRTYARLGRELPGDLTALCRECHEAFHKRISRPKGAIYDETVMTKARDF
jgi:hypothetical protein